MCSDKQCQENVHMWPVKPAKESDPMQSVTRPINMKSTRPKMLQSSNKQYVYEEDLVKSVCSDKNFHENQSINMQPVKPATNVQSVTNTRNKRLYSNKNCQSDRCFKKKCPKRPMCGNDKNCQSTQCM